MDLHRRVRDGFYLRALRVLADRKLFAVRGRLDLKTLPIKFGNLDPLRDRRADRFSPLVLQCKRKRVSRFDRKRLFDVTI